MPDEPELIAQNMESTRASLTDKVAALENLVVGQIHEATETVQHTVHNVKETVDAVKHAVEDTMTSVKGSVDDSVHAVTDSVKSGFGIPDQVRENPWPFVGGATLAGFLTGLLAFGGSRSSGGPRNSAGALGYQPVDSGPSRSDEVRGFYGSAPMAPPTAYAAPAAPRAPGIFDEIMGQVGTELRKLGEEALTTAVASLRQSLQHNLKDGIPHLIDTGMDRIKDSVAGTGTTTNPPHNGPGSV